MPLQPSSTYQMLHECLPPGAYELAKALGDDEIDLRGSRNRCGDTIIRCDVAGGADTVARQTMHLTRATERDLVL